MTVVYTDGDSYRVINKEYIFVTISYQDLCTQNN